MQYLLPLPPYMIVMHAMLAVMISMAVSLMIISVRLTQIRDRMPPPPADTDSPKPPPGVS